MKYQLTITLILLLCLASAGKSAVAQQKAAPAKSRQAGAPEASSGPASKPAAKAADKPAEKKDNPQESDEEDPFAKIFGDGGFNLSALSDDSQLTMESDPATGGVRYLKIKKNIKIESETINLQCDDLVVDMAEGKREMVAVGSPLIFSKDDISGESARLVYNLDTKKMVLTGGSARPWITQKDKSGKVTRTTASVITLTQGESGSEVLLTGRPEIKMLPAAGKEKKEESPAEKKSGEKINDRDEKSLGKIKAPVPQN